MANPLFSYSGALNSNGSSAPTPGASPSVPRPTFSPFANTSSTAPGTFGTSATGNSPTPQCARSARVGIVEALDFDSDVVCVKIGREPHLKRFFVHTKIITKASEYFRRALSGEWKERDDGVIDWPDDEPRIFELYLNLLYTGKIPSQDIFILGDGENIDLCKLYVLAEKIQDIEARNVISTSILLKSRERSANINDNRPHRFPRSEAINILYEGTPENSPMRSMMVDMYCDHGKDEWLVYGGRDCFPYDFLFDVSKGLFKRKAARNAETTATCAVTKYHVQQVAANT